MAKRQKWTEQEDAELQKLIDEAQCDPKWDVVALQMEKLGFHKNAKQCRER